MKHSPVTPPALCKAQKPWGFGVPELGSSTSWSLKWAFLRDDLVQGFALIKPHFRVNERPFTAVFPLPTLGFKQSFIL